MAEEYNVQKIMSALRKKSEMDPDQHDGCYELMRETIAAYSKLKDFSAIDYKDLNLVYLTTVGTWKQGVESKKKTVEDSHLLSDDKEYLSMLWDETWVKASNGEYSNNELDASGNGSIGLFGTGFFSFQRTTTNASARAFIWMCCDILPMTDDNAMFNRAAEVLTSRFQGMRAASASMVLHCLKPYSFPVLNSNMGRANIFEVLGVQLNKRDNIETYIENCRKIKAFRDANFSYKNYRIFDIAAWKVAEYAKKHDYGQFGNWEVLNESTARLCCKAGELELHMASIPVELRWFFRVSELRTGAKQEVVLAYDGFEYDGYFLRESVIPIQIKLYWNESFSEEFGSVANSDEEKVLEFTRIEDDRFEVKLIESVQEEEDTNKNRVWLLTWNRNNWPWNNYAACCVNTKDGNSFTDSWACVSSKPQIGDEIYLLKLGEEPRGIIGHGKVVREQYEKEHYNPEKAAQGIKHKAIDVEFDRLLDYSHEKIISQAELLDKCSAQHWSPQGSGIEIKPEVVPTLRSLWKEVTDNDIEDDYWPSQKEYPVNLSKDDWKRFIQDIEMPDHKGCMRVLACFIDIGGIASPKALADKYKGHPSVYVGSVVNTGRRALDYFGMAPCPDGDVQRYFPIAFQGHSGSGDSSGTYEYKMRPELFEALQEIDLSGINLIYDKGEKEQMSNAKFNHNRILYGPPGTGKTYHCAYYAVSICDGRELKEVEKESYSDVMRRFRELKADGRIAFTTFHQSYGYEEFIEGIKPKLNAESETLGYTIEDGVFKEFCRRASAVKVQETGTNMLKEQPRIWGMLLGGSGMTELKRQCFDRDEVRIGFVEVDDNDVEDDFASDATSSWQAKHMVFDFKNTMEIGDIVVIEKNNTSIDAIGVVTGDYKYDKSLDNYPRSRAVKWLVKDIDQNMLQYLPNGRKQLSRFSLFAFDYIGMDVISQILNENTAEPVVEVDQETKPYIFIIDEINRGNISKIFGELITLIEDTKRAGTAEAVEAILPYSGETFSVPNNVYILGTMNTADRSIALMDTALRRRFEFVEMMPNSEVLESLGVGTIEVSGVELKVARMLDVINERIEYLFDREHTIGHAFFTKLAEDPSIETLAGIFEKNVIPLLQEYFYEDYEKIQLVLGDNTKVDEFKFILDRSVKAKDIFNGNPDIDLPEKGYVVQHEAFLKLESYKQIGKDL